MEPEVSTRKWMLGGAPSALKKRSSPDTSLAAQHVIDERGGELAAGGGVGGGITEVGVRAARKAQHGEAQAQAAKDDDRGVLHGGCLLLEPHEPSRTHASHPALQTPSLTRAPRKSAERRGLLHQRHRGQRPLPPRRLCTPQRFASRVDSGRRKRRAVHADGAQPGVQLGHLLRLLHPGEHLAGPRHLDQRPIPPAEPPQRPRQGEA